MDILIKNLNPVYNNQPIDLLKLAGMADMKSSPMILMALFLSISFLHAGCTSAPGAADDFSAQTGSGAEDWQEDFSIQECELETSGSNNYFILEPGFQLVLEGGNEKLVVTVLDETIEIDGVETRVVEEREWRGESITEISYNFFAYCAQNGDMYYFGEDVDMYTDGQLSSHSGAWKAGLQEARAGLIMPGTPLVGMKYFQEIAPGVAMDRAEVISLDERFSTPAGEFEQVLLTREGTALNPLEVEFKRYAPGIGLIQDQKLLLTGYGFVQGE